MKYNFEENERKRREAGEIMSDTTKVSLILENKALREQVEQLTRERDVLKTENEWMEELLNDCPSEIIDSLNKGRTRKWKPHS